MNRCVDVEEYMMDFYRDAMGGGNSKMKL